MHKIKLKATKTLTFEEGCDKYLDYCRQRNLRQGTITHYKQSYTLFYKFFDPKTPIEEIDEDAYKKYVLHSRISQGIREAKRNGTQIGLTKGTILITDKSVKCKEIIKKHAVDFGGTLSDKEVMILCKISRNSYYKYKRELKV